MDIPTTVRLLRISEVMAITGLGRDAIYRLSKKAAFPLPRKIGSRASAWRSDEISRWVESRPVSRAGNADKQLPNPSTHQGSAEG